MPVSHYPRTAVHKSDAVHAVAGDKISINKSLSNAYDQHITLSKGITDAREKLKKVQKVINALFDLTLRAEAARKIETQRKEKAE